MLDGQQRIISVCSYIHDDYSIDHRFWHNLSDDEKKHILDYELEVRVCDGTNDEKLAYFKRINVPGVVMTEQELLNATYTGAWLSDAKEYFSKRTCSAGKFAENYIHGNPIRQDYLKTVLNWIADRDHLGNEQEYMAVHQNDKDANELWQYFQQVISWAKMLFPKSCQRITDHQEWGLLYNKYHDRNYNTNELDDKLHELIMNDDVKKKTGIIPFLLSDQNDSDYTLLNLGQFTKSQILKQYNKQNGICPICHKHYELDEMEADHIEPFSWGKDGWSSSDNLQMLCRHDNRIKSNK